MRPEIEVDVSAGGDFLLGAVRGAVQDEVYVVATRRRHGAAWAARERAEADIQKGCLQLLHRLGYALTTTGSRYVPTGTPDILGCVQGRMVAFEVKKVGKKPTPTQFGQLRAWAKAGALVGWVCDEQHVTDLLDHVGDLAWANPLTAPGDGRCR